MQYCRSDQSAHALVTYMNNVTQTCNNMQIRNDGGDESIAFWENTTSCQQSLFLTLIQKWQVEEREYSHTKSLCIRREKIKIAACSF